MRNGWPLLDTHLSDKFQEWTPGNRCISLHSMTRRPNVNGQIALNNSAGQGDGKVRCVCTSFEGRKVLPARATGLSSLASLGDPLDSQSISSRRVACSKEFPVQ